MTQHENPPQGQTRPSGVERGMTDERGAVTAWLYAWAEKADREQNQSAAAVARLLAHAVKSGEHRR